MIREFAGLVAGYARVDPVASGLYNLFIRFPPIPIKVPIGYGRLHGNRSIVTGRAFADSLVGGSGWIINKCERDLGNHFNSGLVVRNSDRSLSYQLGFGLLKTCHRQVLSKFSRTRREANKKKKRHVEYQLSKLVSSPIEVVLAEIQYSRSIMQVGFSFVSVLIIGFIQAVATELRLSPYLGFMNDATLVVQMFPKNTALFRIFKILLLLGSFFSVLIFLTSNRQISFLRNLLHEHHRREKAKYAK